MTISILICNVKIPDHAAESDALAPNPNIRCTGWQFIELPINPGKVGIEYSHVGQV